MKKIFSKLVIMTLCATMLPVPEVRAAKKPSATKTMKLTVGQSKTIKVKGSYIKCRKYKASNKNIVAVTKKGKVTAKKKGKCKITVTVRYKKSKKAKKYISKKLICNVTVKAKEETKLTNNPKSTIKATDKPVETEKPNNNVVAKNKNDVEALTKIIKQQRELGAAVSEDLDSDEYTWEKIMDHNMQLRLVKINWYDNELQGDLSFVGLEELKELICADNRLTNLDVSNNAALEGLWCQGNQLTNLDLSKNIALKNLWCEGNQLTNLDLSKNTALERLGCTNNRLTNLDVSKNTALKVFSYDNMGEVIRVPGLYNSNDQGTTGWLEKNWEELLNSGYIKVVDGTLTAKGYFTTSDGEDMENEDITHRLSGDIVVADGVTKIGEKAFYFCSELTKITIPDSVTCIADEAFANCGKLQSVSIPDNVTSIGDEAFRNCSDLQFVDIPNSVMSIGSLAFYDCSNLSNVDIANSMTDIGSTAFGGTSWLSKQIRENDFVIVNGILISHGKDFAGDISVPEGVICIGDGAFAECGLRNVSLPDSLVKIGGGAFCGSTLESINIPNGVTSIGEYAFLYCDQLKRVFIPNSVISIGAGAFEGIPLIVYAGNAAGAPWGAKKIVTQ